MRSPIVLSCALLVSFATPLLSQQIPAGTAVTVRTIDTIASKSADAGQSYRCTLESPVAVNGKEVAARGADCILRVVGTKDAGKLTGNNELTLQLSQVRVGGDLVSVNSSGATMAGKGKGKSTAIKSGIGAAAGAGLGGLFGGGKGAAIGAGAGAGAGVAVAAVTSGPEVKVPSETVLNFTIQ